MPVGSRQQRVGVFRGGTRQYYGTGASTKAQVPVIRQLIGELTHDVLTVVIKLPDAGIQRNTSTGGTRSTPTATAPRTDSPTKIEIVNVCADRDLVCADHGSAAIANIASGSIDRRGDRVAIGVNDRRDFVFAVQDRGSNVAAKRYGSTERNKVTFNSRMRGISNSQNGGAGACCKRDIASGGSASDRRNVVPDAPCKHVELAVSAADGVRNTRKAVPRKDLGNHADQILGQGSKLFPATDLLGKTVTEAYIVTVNPAALSTVFGVLFVNAGGKRQFEVSH